MRTSHPVQAILAILVTFIAASSLYAGAKVGEKPDINWTAVDRKAINEETLKGWVRLVIFWDTEDGWTARQTNLRTQLDSYYRRGVQVIGYNLDKSADPARRMSRDLRLSWLLVSDPKGLKTELLPEWSVERPPYAVLISPDGVVRWRGHPQAMDGSVDKVLAEHPPQLTEEQWVKQAVVILQDTTREIEEDMRKGAIDYRPALATLSEINPKILSDPAVVQVARKLMPYFEPKRDTERYSLEAYVDAYPKAKEAIALLKEEMKPKTVVRTAPAAPTKEELAKKLEEQAQQRLAAAQEHQTAGRDLLAYRGFKQTAERFAGTPSGKTAAERVKAYEASPELMEKIKKAQAEEEATAMLRMANNYRASEKEEEARALYQKVVDQFPNTEWAKQAAEALAK